MKHRPRRPAALSARRRLPYLLAAGDRGPILCSPASAELLPMVLEDALKVGFTRKRRLIEQVLAAAGAAATGAR